MDNNEELAFPVQASEYGGHGTVFGMSLRDYFAAKALATAYAYPSDDVQHWDASDFAKHAYAIADAMLAARNA